MPIDAYVGKPGHGKSYGVVQHVIIPSLKQGRHVVTNIPLQVEMLLEDYPQGSISQLPDDWDKRDDLGELVPNGCVLILDELWRRWPSGLKATSVLEQDKALLAEHRHRVDKNNKSMRIVLVTQDLSQIASFARALIEQTYRVVKKTKKAYRVDIYSGAATGDRPPKTQLQRQSFGTYKSEVYRYYKSATQSETGDVGDESKADQRGNIWRSPILWILLIAVPLLIGPGVWGVRKFFNPDSHGVHVQSELVNPAPPVAVPVAHQVRSSADRVLQASTGVSTSGALPMSPTWRIAGWLGCSTPVDGDPSRVKPCGASVTGAGTVSRTSAVVLTNEASTRFVRMDECRWIEQGLYLLCDVDGERVTPWTGRGAVTKVVDPEATAQAPQATDRGERSDPRPVAAVAHPGSSDQSLEPHATATVVTVVPDTEYSSRPWRSQQ